MVKITIRWSDIDANRHLANSAYVNFMSHARVAYMKKAGVSQRVLERLNLGPVVFDEHFFYFKEVLPDQPVYVDVELSGLSEKGTFFSFTQNMYDSNGKNVAAYEMTGGWIDLEERKLRELPDDLLKRFTTFHRSKDFRTLTKSDTRTVKKHPIHIDSETLDNAELL